MTTTEEIISQFFTVGRKVKQRLDGGARSITLPQLETLRFIQEHQPATMSKVADFLAVTPPSATVIIDALVRPGLVTRRRDPKNRRTVYLHLTGKGEKLLKAAFKQRCVAFQQLLRHLSKHEQLTFLRLMQKLAMN